MWRICICHFSTSLCILNGNNNIYWLWMSDLSLGGWGSYGRRPEDHVGWRMGCDGCGLSLFSSHFRTVGMYEQKPCTSSLCTVWTHQKISTYTDDQPKAFVLSTSMLRLKWNHVEMHLKNKTFFPWQMNPNTYHSRNCVVVERHNAHDPTSAYFLLSASSLPSFLPSQLASTYFCFPSHPSPLPLLWVRAPSTS